MAISRGRRLRAPAEDGAALIDPPLIQIPALIQKNIEALKSFDRLACFPEGYRATARATLQRQARRSDGDSTHDPARQPLILTGHQPELHHPGVWLKNFLASSLAKAAGGQAINLIVDNDVCRATVIRVPCDESGQPSVELVPFDAARPPVPWETREIADVTAFERFPADIQRVFGPNAATKDYRSGILIHDLWPAVLETAKQFHSSQGSRAQLATCLMHGRRALESRWNVEVADCPLSVVAETQAFATFADHLLKCHREFRSIYNTALAEYRHVNRIRSQTHPVPELDENGEWQETPFWMWTDDEPIRKRVFVRSCASGVVEITDREQVVVRVESVDEAGRTALLDNLRRHGVRLRPRALMTTMYARLVLSDLFIHGIGGAKYDELTDLIIRRFFGIEPPAYVTATATFRLPIERPQATVDDLRASARRLRELRYRPESFLNDALVASDADRRQQLAALAAEKREFLDRHDLRRCAPEVFHSLDRLNQQMHGLLAPIEREHRARHDELLMQFKQAQLLGSREFSFVLFPSEILPARLLDLCKVLT